MSDVNEEPTGIEILQHILRDCKYQACYVSIIDEKNARISKQAVLLSAYNIDHLLFVDVDGEFWRHVVPIDSQGNALTADAVGFKNK